MKKSKKLIILSVIIMILIFIGLIVFCWLTQSINGIKTATMSKEQIKSLLEKVEPTSISYENSNIDITSICSYSVDEFEKGFGSQVIKVRKSVDKKALRSKLNGIDLSEVEKIDTNKLAKEINYGGSTDLSNYITDKYSAEVTDRYKKLLNWSVSYNNGYKSPSTKSYIIVRKNGEIALLDGFFNIILNNLNQDYNTLGKAVSFKDHTGKKHKIKSPNSTWGDKIDINKERKFLVNAVKTGKSVKNREPEFEQKTGKLGNSYIEVSISKQKVWLVKNGKVVISSPCVTGRKGIHDTPKGVFHILERRSGKWLTGDNYRTWVNRWLRVTWRGIGLHDANWRSSFGGNIYKYNGSHGCINLPYNFIRKLFNKVSWGYPVVIH